MTHHHELALVSHRRGREITIYLRTIVLSIFQLSKLHRFWENVAFHALQIRNTIALVQPLCHSFYWTIIIILLFC